MRHQLENPKGQTHPLRGHPEQAVRVSYGENLPEHFTPHSQFGISVGNVTWG